MRRADGGTHAPANLTLRCSACHAAHHAGKLAIRGTAPDRLETVRTTAAAGSAADPAAERAAPQAPQRTEAILALRTLGWKHGQATTAVDEALGHVAHGGSVERLIREALRRCPLPTSA